MATGRAVPADCRGGNARALAVVPPLPATTHREPVNVSRARKPKEKAGQIGYLERNIPLRSGRDSGAKDQARLNAKCRHFGARFVSLCDRSRRRTTESQPTDVSAFMSGLLGRAQPVPSATFVIEILDDALKGGRED